MWLLGSRHPSNPVEGQSDQDRYLGQTLHYVPWLTCTCWGPSAAGGRCSDYNAPGSQNSPCRYILSIPFQEDASPWGDLTVGVQIFKNFGDTHYFYTVLFPGEMYNCQLGTNPRTSGTRARVQSSPTPLYVHQYLRVDSTLTDKSLPTRLRPTCLRLPPRGRSIGTLTMPRESLSQDACTLRLRAPILALECIKLTGCNKWPSLLVSGQPLYLWAERGSLLCRTDSRANI